MVTEIVLTDFSTFWSSTYFVLILKNYFFYKVLILEPTKIYQPSYLSINSEAEEKTVSIWHVLPDDKVYHGVVCSCNFFHNSEVCMVHKAYNM